MSLLDERIDQAKTICILGHQTPDGDCIGSALAIYNYILNKYGDSKIVKIYLDIFSKKYLILPNADKISDDLKDATKFDLAIVVDCGNLDRLKEYKRYFEEAKDSIVFDHHENNDIPARVSVVSPESIATCEVLYPFLDRTFIDKNVAECLYLGLATDSGIFRYKSTNKKTLLMAATLIDYGFDFTKLLDTIVFNNSFNQRKAQGIAFDRLKLICKGQVSYSYLTKDELDNLNITKNDVDNIIVYLREIENIKIAAFAYPVGVNIYKFSLRSNSDKFDLSEFARKHEGGGHMLASGCIYHGNIEDIGKNFEKDMFSFIEDKENSK